MWQALKLKDMAKIEKYMRLIIVASNKYGKLEVKEGKLAPIILSCPYREDVLPVLAPAKKKGDKDSKYIVCI